MDQFQINNNWSAASEDFLVKSFPAHRACRDGDVDQLNSLLSAGNINLYEEDDFYGWTPLHWAAYFGKLPCLMHLLTNGASCDVPTERLNQTPAHIAAYGGHSHCLKCLLHYGATINRQDYMGETPIHKAARTGSMECVSLLVSQGAKLNIRNYSGNTSSQVAATSSYIECANYIERASTAQMQAATGYDEVGRLLDHSGNNTAPSTLPDASQPVAQNNVFVSTNTYHSHPNVPTEQAPHAETNSSPSHCTTNGLNLNNNSGIQADNCDMEMEEDSGEITNGCGGGGQADVLLNEGVSQNIVPLAGKKRSREDIEESIFKRARNDDYVFEHRNRLAFSQLPFSNGFHDDTSAILSGKHATFDLGLVTDTMDNTPALANGFPSSLSDSQSGMDYLGNMESSENQAPDVAIRQPMSQMDPGHCQGEINQNRQAPFSCIKFREPPPVKCYNFMSHYI